ncbi:MAG: dockerin type I repeat-containing protein [Clostridia bacterium]|nr:dockerin type I repeat-containing protein [Clostridia bacterium]
MKKSNTVIKSIFAVVLTIAMMAAMFSSAFAVTISNEELKLQYLTIFNDAVNSIKEKKPSFQYKKTAGISRDENAFNGEDMSEEARKYLSAIVDAFFNPDRGLVNNFIGVLTESNSEISEKEISKGMDTKYFLAPYGKDYVSALAVDDEYKLMVEEKKDILKPESDSLKIRYEFNEYDLSTKDSSPLNKVFDLPSGAINPVIIGGPTFDDENDPLDNIKFLEFKFHDAWVQADFNGEGELVKYKQNISYTFVLSFYDIMRIFDLYTGIDLIEIGLAIANPILQNTGNPTVTAREILQKTEMTIRYDITTELSRFDWTPRSFGDIDNDGAVSSKDARTVLRYCVELEKIKNQEDLIYADVNFDGVINASDARHILRTSVELEEEFDEVPEGQSIKIVVILPPPAEPENPNPPATPENPEVPNDPDGEGGGSVTDEIAAGITEFVNGIFDVIENVRGDGNSDTGIEGLIQQIKDIIATAKGEKDDSGIIIVPDKQ